MYPACDLFDHARCIDAVKARIRIGLKVTLEIFRKFCGPIRLRSNVKSTPYMGASSPLDTARTCFAADSNIKHFDLGVICMNHRRLQEKMLHTHCQWLNQIPSSKSQPQIVLRRIVMPIRAKRSSSRYSGRWSPNFEKITGVQSPGPGKPFSIGCGGFGATTTFS